MKLYKVSLKQSGAVSRRFTIKALKFKFLSFQKIYKFIKKDQIFNDFIGKKYPKLVGHKI